LHETLHCCLQGGWDDGLLEGNEVKSNVVILGMRYLICSRADWHGIPEIRTPVNVYREPALITAQQSP
jgi:hypothetical protein